MLEAGPVDGLVGGMVVNAARTHAGAYDLLAVVSQDSADGGPLRLAQDGTPLQPLPLPYELPTLARISRDGD